MSNIDNTSREILADSKTVRSLLSNVKYTIDYYQRDYKWTEKQVRELVEDLTRVFYLDYDENKKHERQEVANYRHYFLGSIVISARSGQRFIIDGQQRLTTLTILLIYLNNLQRDRSEKVDILNLIFSEKYGKKSYNLDVPERVRCMDCLFSTGDFNGHDSSESVQNIVNSYKIIQNCFPEGIEDDTLPYFIDWLIDNVHLVEITAYSDDDAYTIFETMNDRGLSLTPTDMLKGFLLKNINDEDKRNEAAITWKRIVEVLANLGQDETANFFKAWLRSQYADTIRERKKGAQAQDFDRLGTEYHRWIRENVAKIGLNKSDNFYEFIQQNLTFYACQYELIYRAANSLVEGLESVFYVARLGFTLQGPLLLSTLNMDDDEIVIRRKLQVTARYIESMLARRLWNWHSITYSTLQYSMFNLMKDIRGKSLPELVVLLTQKLENQAETFDNPRFSIHKMNRYTTHCLLARMTETLETNSGLASHYEEYINIVGDNRNPYEVEHVWANHYDRHKDEFGNPTDFQEFRNRIGGLLLLQKKFNISYGDLPYNDKWPHYTKQNLLAGTLHPLSYEHHPDLIAFIHRSGLPFHPHSVFKKADLEERTLLYCQLAALTWSPERLKEAAEA